MEEKKAKKNKSKKQLDVFPAEGPINQPVADAVPVVPKTYEVNCPGCGAYLSVEVSGVAYMCPVCHKILRIRKKEKLVKDVSRVVVAEAYISVDKGVNEQDAKKDKKDKKKKK